MISRTLLAHAALYFLAALFVLGGVLYSMSARAQSGGQWASCTLYWFGMFVGPAECGSPPPGSECYASCSGNLPGFCPPSYCWSVWIPDAIPACPTAGQGCTSGANSCGMRGSGTIVDSGGSCVCTASTPSDSLCPPPSCSNGSAGPYPSCPLPSCADLGMVGTYPACSAPPPACVGYAGSSCSVSNSCGNATNYGTYDCSGNCSASAPSESSCTPPPSGDSGSGSNPACSDSGTPSLTVAPNRVVSGTATNVTFTWNVSYSTAACTLTGPSGTLASTGAPTSSCSLAGTVTKSVTLTNQGVYTLTCPGNRTAQAVVNIIPVYGEF